MKADIAPAQFAAGIDDCLSIEVTTRCNGKCRHCFAQAGVSTTVSLAPGVAKNIITEGYHTDYRQLHITGGEPLLWDGLFEALDFAFDIGYQNITMNTNGRLLTGKIARRLAAYEGLSISVSLEGPLALHDRIRGEGTYRPAVRGIDIALDAGIDLAIFSVAGKSLLEVLPQFAHTVYKRFSGIQHLTLIQLIAATHNGFDLADELLEPYDFLELVETVCILNLCGLDTRIKNSPLARVVSKLIDMPWVLPTYPLYRAGSLIVMADGNINLSHSCRDSLGKYTPGMIRQALSSDEYLGLVAPNQSTCPACQYHELCKENCMSRPSEPNMDLRPEIPYCKRVLDLKPTKYNTSDVKKEDMIGSGEKHFQPEHLT
jgi:radical SAM protein with 4Fe4S-binding SPASM domain